MVGDNKILTVSYGTFSCTLEGFDDPFSTMKNIAEYFRDLAAGDRFFGAEPPQPDPEMLQSIAEQTIQARVNAQLSDNGLVLRQDTSAAQSAAAPMAAAAAAAVVPQVAPQVAPLDAAPTPGVETVAEKLQRIRAVVSRETAQDAFFSEDQHVDEFAAETTAPLGAVEMPVVVEEDSAPETAPVVEPQADVETPDEEVATEVAADVEAVEDAPVEEDVVEEDVVSDEAVADDVVANEAVDGDTVADETVDESAQFEDEADVSGDIDLNSIVGDQSSDDTAEEIAAEDTSKDAEDDTPVADASEDDPNDATSREEAAETAVDNVLGKVSDEGSPEDATPRRRIVVQKITREDLKAAREEAARAAELKDKAAVAADVTEVAEVAEVAEDVSEEAADVVNTSSELPPEQEEDLLRELAALQSDSEETSAEMTFENDPTADTSAEDQGDLTDELAGVLATSKDEDTSADDDLADALSDLVNEDAEEYKNEELSAARELRRARRDAITEEHEDDVERLISATSSRIDNDESSQRRASIAHLKAAVAATKADSSLADAAQEHEARERDQYAEDLARVVRPERKAPTGERGKTDRPSPLVLVSELRIDKEDDVDTADEPAKDDDPVRPRRISRAEFDDPETTAEGHTFSDPDQASFADYAASANAMELPDLLEAAAAYYTFVESTEQFTRPMLMRKIASISERDGLTREAGLRSFGTLLREGKLVKGSDGKFVIAKNSRFTPEARYAGE